jgi:hypothetical protein
MFFYNAIIMYSLLFLLIVIILALIFCHDIRNRVIKGSLELSEPTETNKPSKDVEIEYSNWLNVKEMEDATKQLNRSKEYETLNILERRLISKAQNDDFDYRSQMKTELIKKKLASPEMIEKYLDKIDNISNINKIETPAKFNISQDGVISYKKYNRKISPERLKKLRELAPTRDEEIVLAAIRYSCLLPRGQQWHVPSKVYQKLMKEYSISLEGFASPFNFNVPKFCSIFPEKDKVFGSIGNFFNTKLTNQRAVINPPFIENILNEVADKCIAECTSGDPSESDTFLIIITPAWKDASYHVKLSKIAHVISHKAGSYYYENEGTKIPAKFDSTWFILSSKKLNSYTGLENIYS